MVPLHISIAFGLYLCKPSLERGRGKKKEDTLAETQMCTCPCAHTREHYLPPHCACENLDTRIPTWLKGLPLLLLALVLLFTLFQCPVKRRNPLLLGLSGGYSWMQGNNFRVTRKALVCRTRLPPLQRDQHAEAFKRKKLSPLGL